jgi:hypothetical protein
VVNVSRARASGDVSVRLGAARGFKPANWSEWQVVTLGAVADANADSETAVFRVSLAGADDQFVEATTLDGDIGENLALAASGSAISSARRTRVRSS